MNEFILKHFGRKQHFIVMLVFLSIVCALGLSIIIDFIDSAKEFYTVMNALKNY